jgi:hypothetical protein
MNHAEAQQRGDQGNPARENNRHDELD